MAASGMADQRKVSAAIVAESEERSYVFKVHGYSRLKELFKNRECVASPPFSVGGDNWVLKYYPNGSLENLAAYIFLLLHSVDGKGVNAKPSSIRVLDKDGLPVAQSMGNISESMLTILADMQFIVKNCLTGTRNSSFGTHIHRAYTEQSGYM
jgi:hypothetical protein